MLANWFAKVLASSGFHLQSLFLVQRVWAFSLFKKPGLFSPQPVISPLESCRRRSYTVL